MRQRVKVSSMKVLQPIQLAAIAINTAFQKLRAPRQGMSAFSKAAIITNGTCTIVFRARSSVPKAIRTPVHIDRIDPLFGMCRAVRRGEHSIARKNRSAVSVEATYSAARMGARTLLLILIVLVRSSAQSAETMQSQLYEIVIETAMPHLEENLRYATTREQRCLEPDGLWSMFPILDFPALKDCRLEQESRREDAVSYALICNGGHGTTGHATWRLGQTQSIGTLDVKLGGKNMTLSQRVTARMLGDCAEP
jgi:hypothetical protein